MAAADFVSQSSIAMLIWYCLFLYCLAINWSHSNTDKKGYWGIQLFSLVAITQLNFYFYIKRESPQLGGELFLRIEYIQPHPKVYNHKVPKLIMYHTKFWIFGLYAAFRCIYGSLLLGVCIN